MNRITKKYRELARAGRKAFVAYIAAGDPTLGLTHAIARTLEGNGVDILELGIPFSDPIADGPTIQAASQRALANGVTLAKIFAAAKRLRKGSELPIVFMTYYNPVFRYGIERFVRNCAASGVDGIIVPDLPHEESGALERAAARQDIAFIHLIAPTSTRARVATLARRSRGFVYYVSLTGVTGSRRTLPPEIGANVRCVKSVTKTPVFVGFGIADPAQARRVARSADGVIVGSALIKVIERNLGNRRALLAGIAKFSRRLAGAIHGA